MEKDLTRYTKVDIIGPGVWFSFHLIAKRGTRTDLERMVDHLRKTFPCEECRSHFTKMSHRHDLDKVKDIDLFKKVYEMHAIVNKRLEKATPPFEDVVDFFEDYRAVRGALVRLTDPKVIGPGIWWMLHSSAEHNPTFFERLWDMLLNYFPCEECREEINRYERREEVCQFGRSNYPQYVWNLHDEINIKLGKTSPGVDIVIDFFRKNEACKVGCTSKSNEEILAHGRYV